MFLVLQNLKSLFWTLELPTFSSDIDLDTNVAEFQEHEESIRPVRMNSLEQMSLYKSKLFQTRLSTSQFYITRTTHHLASFAQ